ncbi:alpha/beta-hydrolase [Fomitiporia mediterranea MF3/22]|uniref:alpha/beta-hydrolase n=1 Tax=Fomitiporia mediterranea (strain MF3/22) TaxID=694068 RepID=UPI0004407FF9|nr:alpha/beta-hydrolase [Fomitiporia mediterranea MF3/22]EJD02657.1 alpha/beta-hydrolase [Fomitiporia mediterranea MF3/22]
MPRPAFIVRATAPFRSLEFAIAHPSYPNVFHFYAMSEFPSSPKILVSSDGTKIYADASGDTSKPSIIFVHGLGLSGAVFDRIFSDKRYTEHFYLVRYDMRGHGRSGKPINGEGYASNLFADDFAVVMKAFNLHKPVFVGWSFGATIPVDIATNFSDIPLADVIYLCGVPYTSSIVQQIATPEILSLVPGLTSEDSVVTALSITREFVDLLFLDATKIPWELLVLWTHHDSLSSGNKDFCYLFLGGAYDRLIMSNVVADKMRPYFKNLEVHLIEKGGSHAVFFENQDETMDKIIDFTQRVNGHENVCS